MKKSHFLTSSALAIATNLALFTGIAHAQELSNDETIVVVDGAGSSGYVITDALPGGALNTNVMNSAQIPANVNLGTATATVDGSVMTVGSDLGQTVFSNFTTSGGDGSGGGAGLGGVFFVDDGRTLTLNNVSMLNNAAQGGTGGIGDIGGSMNRLVSPGTAASGQNGANASEGFAQVGGGSGGSGYAGSNGYSAALGVGGAGGRGGAGSNGAAVTADTVWAALNIAYDAVQLAKTTKDASDFTALAAEFTALAAAAAAGVNAGGPTTTALAPLFTTLATQFTAMAAAEAAQASEDLKRLLADTALQVALTVTAYELGASGAGGSGGSGGTGGDGSKFFSGGIGGAGGYGGYAVGSSGAVGGEGGAGGDGGFSGFGAGGASGGPGGAGGASGSSGGVGNFYLDGDSGEGGSAGFGGGSGSTRTTYYGSGQGYQYEGGGGGSGFGGAIFVADGGTLNITGNALFANNYVLAGSSENDGEAGQAAGTDLFMMKGSTVNLLPGIGNTIRFEGTIADDSSESIEGTSIAKGKGADIQIGGGGLVQFAGDNTYTGTTFISGATLDADIGAGINDASRITFNGAGTIRGGEGEELSSLTAGVLLTSGEIVRQVSTNLPVQISWTGSGGFAAESEGLTLNFGKLYTMPQGQLLTWGSRGFVGNGDTLVFGSEYGIGVVTLVNSVNLNNLQGRIAVYDNEDVNTDWVVLAGKYTNGTLQMNDAGYTGTAYFTNKNSLSGFTLNEGYVSTKLDGFNGRLMDATHGGDLLVRAGELYLANAEKLKTTEIWADGLVTAASNITSTGDITNYGQLAIGGNLSSTANIYNLGNGILAVNGAVTAYSVSNSVGGEITLGSNLNSSTNVVNAGQFTVAGNLTAGDDIFNGSTGTLAIEGAVSAYYVSNADGGKITVGSNLSSSTNVVNAGQFTVAGNLTAGGDIFNEETGSLLVDGSTSARYILNQGYIGLQSGGSARHIVNSNLGIFKTNGDLSVTNYVYNDALGEMRLGGDVVTGEFFENNGLLVVLSDEVNGINESATRKITTSGFWGDGLVVLEDPKTVTNSLIIDQSDNSTFSGSFIGGGALTKTGAGVLTLTGDSSFTGGLNINAGGITTAAAGTLADTLDIMVASGANFTVGYDDEVRSITNAGTFINNSALTLTSLTNSGTATNNAELLVRGNVTNSGALTSSAAFEAKGNVSNTASGTITLQSGSANQFASLTNSGTIAADSAITVTGAYTQNAGSLTTNSALNTGSLSGTGGTITLNNNALYTVNQTVNGTFSGTINGNGTINKTGAATLTLNGGKDSFSPSAVNIQQGTLAVDGAGILDDALTVSVSNGATLELLRGDQTINNLTGSGSLSLNGNNLYLAQGGNFAGTVNGSGNVQLTSGTFSLANTINSAAGNFQVQSNSVMNVARTGTLSAPVVDVSGSLNVEGIVRSTTNNVNGVLHLGNNSGSVSGTLVSNITYVNRNGLLSGVGSVTGRIIVGGSTVGTIAPGNSPGIIATTDLTLDSNSIAVMEIEGNAGAGLATGHDLITLTGKLSLLAGSTLQIANSNTFELNLGEKVQIFSFAPGAVSGQFGKVTSAFSRSVAFNNATGTVVGLGSYTPSSFETAVAKTANEQAMINQLRVATNGGVNQYYGGRLIEFAASALANGSAAAVATVFDKASPEAYVGLLDHMKLSVLDNRLELGGYENVDRPTYFMTGSVNLGQARSREQAGYLRYESKDQRFNIGAAAQMPFGKVQVSYGRTDGSVKTAYMNSDVKGDQYSIGASVPVAFDGSLRLTGRFSYGDYGFKGTRVTNAGTASFANVEGNSTVFGGGFEYLKTSNRLSVGFSAELLSVLNKVKNFTETGVGPLESLMIHDQRDRFEVLGADLNLGYEFQPGIQGFMAVSVDQDLQNRLHEVSANVLVEAVSMTVTNPGSTSTRVDGSIGARFDLTDAIRFTVEGNAGNASRYGGKASVSIRF